MIQLAELLKHFEHVWPKAHADDWDNVGLAVGSNTLSVSKVLVAVDLTEAVIDEAVQVGANLILTHHPLLLKPIDSVAEDQLKGSLISKLIQNSIALYCAHTNADVQSDGASSLMANAFRLQNTAPLVDAKGGFGHGVIGDLASPLTLVDFATKVAAALPATARKVVFSGEPGRLISRVALCSGAGDSFLPVVLLSNADVYVTSDFRHHPALDAISTPREHGPLALIDVSHWAAESLWLASAISKLSTLSGIDVVAATTSTDPWTQEVN